MRRRRLLPVIGLLACLTVPPALAQSGQTIADFVFSSELTAANTAMALKRCVGLYQAYNGGVRTAQLPKSDIWRTMKANGPKLLYAAARLEPLPDLEETLKRVTEETDRLGGVYADLLMLNLEAGKPPVDDFIKADLEFCHAYALTLPDLTELVAR